MYLYKAHDYRSMISVLYTRVLYLLIVSFFFFLSGLMASGTSINLESKYLSFFSQWFFFLGGGIHFIKVFHLSLRTLLSSFTLMKKLAVELTVCFFSPKQHLQCNLHAKNKQSNLTYFQSLCCKLEHLCLGGMFQNCLVWCAKEEYWNLTCFLPADSNRT